MRVQYNHKLVELAGKLRNKPTYTERIVWNFLKSKELSGYDFHRQKPIGDYIADFYCFKLRLVIEIDGITHEDPEVKRKDIIKEKYLTGIGLKVIRFTDDEVLGNGNRVEEAIRAVVAEIEAHNTYMKDYEKIG